MSHVNQEKKPATGNGELLKALPLDYKASRTFHQQQNEQAFREAMRSSGVDYWGEVMADDEIHRFAPGRKGDKDGWYVFYGSAGAYGDWRQGIKGTWSVNRDSLSTKQKAQVNRQIKEAQRVAAEETQRKQEEAAIQSQKDWGSFSEEGASPYLDRKQVKALGVRFGQDPDQRPFVAIPLRDVRGKLWSYQKIYDEGSKRFLKGGRKKGCFHLLGSIQKEQPVYVVEGYATGASVHQATGNPVVVALDAGNLEHVIQDLRQRYPDREIIIAGDDDRWKEGKPNVGREKAEALARQYGCGVVFPVFSNEHAEHKPTDFNDLHCLQGMEAVQKQLAEVRTSKPPSILPPGFTHRKEGLYYDDDWVCSPLEMIAYTHDDQSQNWGRLIRFKDFNDHVHEIAIPMEWLGGDGVELCSWLLSLGLRISPKKKIRSRFMECLQNTVLQKKALCTSRIGWYKDHFVLPDTTIPETEAFYLQTEPQNFVGFTQSNTLEEWQHQVALLCQGNSRLIFALSCAFAPPLLPLLGQESGGFNFLGSSSVGKSTALAVAASVWGSPDFVQQWKTTGNALEAVAEAHNHALLCLDELGQIDGREAHEIAYMLANGSGKNRLKGKGGLRRHYRWNLLFLSTGEVSIADKAQEAGQQIRAGILTRMVDIPAEVEKGYGIFETLNGFDTGHAFSQALKQATGRCYGIPIRVYLQALVQPKMTPPHDSLQLIREKIQKDFFEQYVPHEAEGQVKRVAERFVTAATAGELAIDLGILPYERGEALKAAGLCFLAWLQERDGVGNHELEAGLQQVIHFFEVHHSTRFALKLSKQDTRLYGLEEKIPHQAGYKDKTETGEYEFWVFPETFKKEICKGYSPRVILAELVKRGLLFKGTSNQFVQNVRLAEGQKKLYHFTSRILGGE